MILRVLKKPIGTLLHTFLRDIAQVKIKFRWCIVLIAKIKLRCDAK
jgi:hypothetical protein